MKPRRVILNPMQVAMGNVALLPKKAVADVKRALQDALNCLARCEASHHHWEVIADALNVAESLSDLGIGSDHGSVDTIQRGQAVLADIRDRAASRGTWAMRYSEAHEVHEMEALEAAVFLHGVQLDHATFSEYERAIEKTRERIKQALAGNAGRNTRIVGALGVVQ